MILEPKFWGENYSIAVVEALGKELVGICDARLYSVISPSILPLRWLRSYSQTPYKLYLLVGEYDNFANKVMIRARTVGMVKRDVAMKAGMVG